MECFVLDMRLTSCLLSYCTQPHFDIANLKSLTLHPIIGDPRQWIEMILYFPQQESHQVDFKMMRALRLQVSYHLIFQLQVHRL